MSSRTMLSKQAAAHPCSTTLRQRWRLAEFGVPSEIGCKTYNILELAFAAILRLHVCLPRTLTGSKHGHGEQKHVRQAFELG